MRMASAERKGTGCTTAAPSEGVSSQINPRRFGMGDTIWGFGSFPRAFFSVFGDSFGGSFGGSVFEKEETSSHPLGGMVTAPLGGKQLFPGKRNTLPFRVRVRVRWLEKSNPLLDYQPYGEREELQVVLLYSFVVAAKLFVSSSFF